MFSPSNLFNIFMDIQSPSTMNADLDFLIFVELKFFCLFVFWRHCNSIFQIDPVLHNFLNVDEKSLKKRINLGKNPKDKLRDTKWLFKIT